MVPHRLMHAGIVLIVLILGIAPLSAFAQDVPSERFVSSAGSLSFSYPSGWVTMEDQGMVLLTNDEAALEEDTVPPGAVGVLVLEPTAIGMVVDELPDTSPESVATAVAESISFGGTDMGVIPAPEGITLEGPQGDRHAARLLFTMEEGEVLVVAVDLGEGNTLAVVAGTAPGEMAQFEASILEVAASVEYVPAWHSVWYGHEDWVNGVAFSPDGALLAASGQDGVVRVWELARGRQCFTINPQRYDPADEDGPPPVYGLSWMPDGKLLATGSFDGFVRLWDAATGAFVREMHGAGAWIAHIACSPNGATIAAARVDGTAWVWDAQTGEDLFIMEAHAGVTERVVYSTQWDTAGPTLASCGSDGEVVLWSAATGDYLGSLGGHAGGVIAASFSPDGKCIAVASWDHAIRVWQVDATTGTAQLAHTVQGHMDSVHTLAWHPTEPVLVTASDEDVLRIWDADAGTLRATRLGEPLALRCVAYSPDGALLAVGGQDGSLRVEDAATGTTLIEFNGHTEPLLDLAFSADGAWLASAGADNIARVWDVATGEQVRALTEFAGRVTSVAFSPDGSLLAAAAEDGVVRVYDAFRWERVHRFPADAGVVQALAFSPDGSVLAAACHNRTVRLWGMEEGAPIGTLRGHRAPALDVAFRADGRTVASAGADGDVRLWDALTDRVLAVLEGGGTAATTVGFSADGRRVAAGGADGVVRVWDVPEVGAAS